MAKGNPTETSHVRTSQQHVPFRTVQSGVTTGNPYNEHVRNEGDSWVLGPGVKAQDAGRNTDTPVQPGAQMPSKDIVNKAQEVSGAPVGDAPPSSGVLGRG